MAYVENLDGFNPLKAIGRALGAGGRAIVGSIVPGGAIIKNVLDTAAKMPASAKAPDQATAAVQATTAAVQSAAAATPANQSTTDQLLTAVLAKMQTPQAAAPVAVQPGPSAPPVVVTTSVPASAPAAAASSLPPWAIPVAILGGAFLLMSSQKGR